MAEKVVMRAPHALAEAALRAGCKFYFGYPITPQETIGEYWAEHAEEHGASAFVVESEIEAGALMVGAAACGARVMFASSGVGLDLISETISSSGVRLPLVLVTFPRGDIGAGALVMGQSDYLKVTRSIAHGDFRAIVLAPHTVQETVELTYDAFWLADKYLNPVVIIGDWILGMSMEAVTFPERDHFKGLEPKTWALTGEMGRPKRDRRSLVGAPTGGMITSVNVGDVGTETGAKRAPEGAGERAVWQRYEKYRQVERRADTIYCDDAELVVATWGSMARIAKTVVHKLRREGLKVGHFRPITLYPYPDEALRQAVKHARKVWVMEGNSGMMLEDVKLALNGGLPIEFYGRPGGVTPTLTELEYEIRKACQKEKVTA